MSPKEVEDDEDDNSELVKKTKSQSSDKIGQSQIVDRSKLPVYISILP